MSENKFKYLCVRGSVYQLEYVNTDGKHEIKQVGDLLHVNKMIASKQLQSFKPNPEAYFMLEWNLMGHELFNALKDKMTESNKAQQVTAQNLEDTRDNE
ncbi:MAG: hypothetical protein WC365_08235 [Candidatus Babeliales bacterium]